MQSLSTAPPTTGGTASAETYRDVVNRLASAQKKAAPGAPAYSIYVNRRLGRLIAAAAYRAGLTPNGVTAISAAFTFAAIISLAVFPPSWPLGVLVALALAVGYAFDSADGQLARLRGGGSLAGEWLDHVVDCIKTSSLHLAVLISAYRYWNLSADAWLLVPLGFAIVAAVSFFAMILNDQLKAVHAKRSTPPGPVRKSTLLRAILVVPTDYGLLCLVFVLIGAPVLFFAAYVALFVANAGHLVLALRKWYLDMVRLDAAGAPGIESAAR